MSSDMRFCPECNNLLQFRENKAHRQLMYICRSCGRVAYANPRSAEDNCVDRTNYNYRSKEEVLVSADIASDPTLGRTRDWGCGACGGNEAVFFQVAERLADDAMTLVFVCCSCGFWEKQGREEDEAEADGAAARVIMGTEGMLAGSQQAAPPPVPPDQVRQKTVEPGQMAEVRRKQESPTPPLTSPSSSAIAQKNLLEETAATAEQARLEEEEEEDALAPLSFLAGEGEEPDDGVKGEEEEEDDG